VAIVFGVFLLVVGALHLARPDFFRRQVPPYVPRPGVAVALTGVAEIMLGAALALDRHPRVAGAAVAALITSYLPVHVEMIRRSPSPRARRRELLRFPVNAVYIAVAFLLAIAR
jgi:uncharacterized membrane protein